MDTIKAAIAGALDTAADIIDTLQEQETPVNTGKTAGAGHTAHVPPTAEQAATVLMSGEQRPKKANGTRYTRKELKAIAGSLYTENNGSDESPMQVDAPSTFVTMFDWKRAQFNLIPVSDRREQAATSKANSGLIETKIGSVMLPYAANGKAKLTIAIKAYIDATKRETRVLKASTFGPFSGGTWLQAIPEDVELYDTACSAWRKWADTQGVNLKAVALLTPPAAGKGGSFLRNAGQTL